MKRTASGSATPAPIARAASGLIGSRDRPSPLAPFAVDDLAASIDAALPQTQCTRCGYPDCRSYAEAIAGDGAPINQCPPGGADGIARLARLTGRTVLPLNPAHGVESVLRLAFIDEAWCIGCTLCLKACPVDCIVGGPKSMHTVIAAHCTGCELCLPACPVDCIEMRPSDSSATGWSAWSPARAADARDRHAFHRLREQRDANEQDARLAAASRSDPVDEVPGVSPPVASPAEAAKKAAIQTAMARARAARDA